MDDFDLYLDANLTMYSYGSTKTSLCMVKNQPKGGGRSLYNIHCPSINYRISSLFTSKTYEKSLFSKISPAHVYYVNNNNFCIVLRLIDCAF